MGYKKSFCTPPESPHIVVRFWYQNGQRSREKKNNTGCKPLALLLDGEPVRQKATVIVLCKTTVVPKRRGIALDCTDQDSLSLVLLTSRQG